MKTNIYANVFAVFLISLPVGQRALAQDAPTTDEQTEQTPRVRRLQDSINTDQEWVPGQGTDQQRRLERKLSLAARAMESRNFTSPPGSSALKYYQDALEIDPNNAQALAGLEQIGTTLVGRARQMNADGDRAGALDMLSLVRQIQPELPALAVAEAEISQRQQLEERLTEARTALEAGELDQALTAFSAAGQIDAGNAEAQAGISAIVAAWLDNANQLIEADDFVQAEEQLAKVETLGARSADVAAARANIQLKQDEAVAALRTSAAAALAAGNLARAQSQLQAYIDAGGVDSADIAAELSTQRRLASYPVGSEFQDAPYAPNVIVIPAGNFEMGSSEGEVGRYGNEGPLQSIEFSRPFGLAKHEVTVGQFRQFVDATGYQTDAERNGESTIYDLDDGQLTKRAGTSWRNDYRGGSADDGLPVVHVSRADAQAYAEWLATQTGESYRLPSESEFEYALRAGSSRPYWWGSSTPESPIENLAGSEDSEGEWSWGEQGFDGYRDGSWGPAPVGSFGDNPFGLNDMGGNVLEWVGDCYDRSLAGVPTDGSARQANGCERYVIRGGSWANPPRRSRSAQRTPSRPAQSTCLVGFRVARDL